MLNNGDVRCGDCDHYTDDGCEEAAEALALEGWPRASVCPEFSPGEECALVLDEERSGREARARVSAIKNFMSW